MTTRRRTLILLLIVIAAVMIVPGLMLGMWVGVFLVFIPLFAAVIMVLKP